MDFRNTGFSGLKIGVQKRLSVITGMSDCIRTGDSKFEPSTAIRELSVEHVKFKYKILRIFGKVK
jgi:hypothetical protein